MRNFFNVAAGLQNKAITEAIERPVIILINKFDEDSVKKFAEDFDKAQQTKQKVIPIVIDSYGGQVHSAISIYSMIQQSKKPVATIVEGKAMSCGSFLLGVGTIGYRFASVNSCIMLHEVSSGTWGKTTEIKVDVEQTNKLNKQFYSILSKHCGYKPSHFLDLFRSRTNTDWYLTPSMAKKYNIIDRIGLPEIGIKVGIEHVFNFPGKNKGAKK